MQNTKERNAKEMEKDEGRSAKTYDLEDRTMAFARQCRLLASTLKRDIVSHEDIKQLIRSSGSVAANYAESRESLSRKDCLHRLKICKKEAKVSLRSRYTRAMADPPKLYTIQRRRKSSVWLNLLRVQKNQPLATELDRLARESTELTLIFGAIVAKLKDS
jgi:hypothetical protein